MTISFRLRLVARESRMNDLDRDGAFSSQVSRSIDGPHTAVAKRHVDPVFTIEQISGAESSFTN
jgi:hypothetical protein